MVFGLFDPPQTKAQKQAAKSAQALREQAVRDAVIELKMLINKQEQARQAQTELFRTNCNDPAMKMLAAVEEAQVTIDRATRFNEMFPVALAELRRNASSAAGFESLASFELEGRDFMVKLRDEAKGQLVPLGVLVMDARRLVDNP